MPINYSKGKIYKLVNDVNDEIYVGSTTQTLKQRLNTHKGLSKIHPNRHVYSKLNEVGWKNVHIILLEEVESSNAYQLLERERYWYDLLRPTLNKNCPNRSKQEWYNDHPDYDKQYRIDHADAIKQYRLDHALKISNWFKSEKHCSVCDCSITRRNYASHLKSKKHLYNSDPLNYVSVIFS